MDLADIEIVRPTPVPQANLDAFIGLYAVPGNDVVRTLLNVMGNISQAFGGAASLAIAEKLYDGFTQLLGINGVTPEVEALHGGLLRNSGYLLVSNAPGELDLRRLFVSRGRLRNGSEPDSPTVIEFDYCLIAVQRLETVVLTNSTAPDLFGEQWQKVVYAFDGGNEAAQKEFKNLQRTIYGSPDLILRDRDALLAGYLLEYDKATRVLGTEKRDKRVRTRSPFVDNLMKAIVKIEPLYTPLSSTQPVKLTPEEDRDLRSGSSAWTRAAELRTALAKEDAGSVADRIMQASALP